MANQEAILLSGIPLHERGGWQDVLAKLIARRHQEVEDAVENLGEKLNPNTTLDGWLPGLLRLSGWKLVLPTPYAQRRVLLRIPHWRKKMGQTGIFEEIVQYHLQPDAMTVPPIIVLTPRFSSAGDWYSGAFYAGASHVWDKQSRFEVIVDITNPGSYTINNDLKGQIHRILDVVMPPMFLIRMN
jgi:hypothetical protein